MRQCRKKRPAGTALAAKESLPMRGRSSLLVNRPLAQPRFGERGDFLQLGWGQP